MESDAPFLARAQCDEDDRLISADEPLAGLQRRCGGEIPGTVAIPAFEARPAGTVPLTDQAMLGWTPFSYPFNLTQQPAITVPCGLTQAGLPIGLQIVGPMFADALVLRAARAFESTLTIPRPKA